MQARYPFLIKFCQSKNRQSLCLEGHTLDFKLSCFGGLLFDDAGKRANAVVLFRGRLQSHTFETRLICSRQHDKYALIH